MIVMIDEIPKANAIGTLINTRIKNTISNNTNGFIYQALPFHEARLIF